jgi:hypothetical protein
MKSAIVVAALSVLLAFATIAQTAPAEQEQVKQLLMATFDKPDHRLEVAPVAVVGDNAVAGWVQGNQGGRALLRKRNGKWVLILCSGDSLKQATHLEQTGIPHHDAIVLAADLAEQEAKLPAKHVALLSTFEGTMVMDESGAHPSADAHGDSHDN